MTEYSNPKIPEGINVPKEHPLKDFFLMLSGIGIALVLAIMLLSIFAEQLVHFIPFEVEQKLAQNLGQWQPDLPDTDAPGAKSDAATPVNDATALPQLKSDKRAYNTRVQTYLHSWPSGYPSPKIIRPKFVKVCGAVAEHCVERVAHFRQRGEQCIGLVQVL